MDVYQPVEIGSDFLGYRIEETIGRGGMGVVYRAYDLRLKRPVALKLVAPSLARDERFRERFARESELVMSLEHPNVVPIYDAGEVDGRVYLTMRLVDGSDLGSVLRTEGALEPARAMAICTQIAAALDAAHARGLVHRDVKPSNVLLDSTEHVYLADFGLTRSLDDEGGPGEDRAVGTPAYLAPEQLEGRPVDGRADLYSLGCVLYECLTGERVFPRDSRLAEAWAHLEEEPPRASKRRAGLPEAVDAVVGRALAKDPEQRFATCGALVAAAQGALGLRRPAHLRSLAIATAIAAVLAASVAVALVARGGRGSAAPPRTHANTLVRIDPRTSVVKQVIRVGAWPVAVAASRRIVWVYSEGVPPAVSEVDAQTNRVLHRTDPLLLPVYLRPVMGPVLAANSNGAWIVGLDRGRGVVTQILPGGGPPREYPVGGRPVSVVSGRRAIWVLDDGVRDDRLLRLDPATGGVRVQRRFPASTHVDAMTFGFKYVWLVSSTNGTLYRVDPRSNSVDHVHLGQKAGRPAALLDDIWVTVSDNRDETLLVDPHTLMPAAPFGSGDGGGLDTGIGTDAAEMGRSIWSPNVANGEVDRWRPPNPAPPPAHVTDAPNYDGSCMTAIAAGAGAVWVTLAPSTNGACNL